MVEEWPSCPECGDPLSHNVEKDEETGEIKIVFFCEGAGDDEFSFQILTGLTDEDIERLEEIGKTIRKEMQIELLNRKPEPFPAEEP